ncbi:MAG: alpha/beta hydrolase [Verrucomicrobiota bacterium]
MNKKNFAMFGDGFNEKGPKELRIAVADKDDNGKVSVAVVPEPKTGKPASERKFREMQKQMSIEGRNCVLFVHGYNTNLESAVRDAFRIRELYQVEVILFTWPANGGGIETNRPDKPFDLVMGKAEDLHGYGSYLSDKHDAELSKGALDRIFQKLAEYFDKYGEHCEARITLLCHSMGNYLLKKMSKSSIYHADSLIFDNVVLCAADVNNAGHEQWIPELAHRKRIYITINENDFALKWSRRKLGDKQKARLGHYTKNLISPIATYLDFTDAIGVGSSHGYFADGSVENRNVYDTFYTILNGERCESYLDYNALDGTYTVT